MESKKPSSPAKKEAPTVDLKEITQIVSLMAENDLTVFHWERDGIKLKLKRGADLADAQKLLSSMSFHAPQAPVQMAAPGAPSAPPASAAAPAAPTAEAKGPTINSPMVGTFYRASGPDEAPFANIGDSVDENTTVCIIEAMKVMNEIKAEIGGTIARVLVEDGKPVQYGQPLFQLKA
jgi:oxaloacetate decarboxylase alpha subunit/acetyl-CoA carboxylase biotin carboxyl carrier protein